MKKKVIIGVAVALLLTVGIIVSIPRKIAGTYMVCSMEGEVKEAVVDVTIHRGLLRWGGLVGTIELDGVEYATNKQLEPYVWGVQEIRSALFQMVIPEPELLDYEEYVKLRTTELLNFSAIKEGNDYYIELWQTGQNPRVYWGPAQSAEEAAKISDIIDASPDSAD